VTELFDEAIVITLKKCI